MKWDLSKFNQCEVHGHHAGSVCPLCIEAVIAVGAAAAPAVEPVEECDRTNRHRGPEAELHGWLETELIRLGISYVHARMDKELTIRKGWPDWSCFYTAPDGVCRSCFVELKSKTTPVLKDQKIVIAELRALNIPVIVTGDFAAAVAFIKLHLAYPS